MLNYNAHNILSLMSIVIWKEDEIARILVAIVVVSPSTPTDSLHIR
jgi:hypothetical protein